VSQPTVSRVRKQYFEEGLEAALNRRPPNRHYHRKLDGEQEARLLALASSEPPEGQARWSLRLLADRMVELDVVEEVSYQTIRRTLEKTLKPHLKKQWPIPPEANAEFVWRMEDVLEVYTRPYNPLRPRSAGTRPQSNCSETLLSPCRWSQEESSAETTSMSVAGW
jgi:homeodomain-containing protein